MESIEQQIAANPYYLKNWLTLLNFLEGTDDFYRRFRVYERALSLLPRSYKLWFAYLSERTRQLRGYRVDDRGYSTLIETYERALVYLNKMPVIWQNYGQLLTKLGKGTAARLVFNRALQSLPITQHEKIWELFREWALQFGCKQSIAVVLNRYATYDSSFIETIVADFLEAGLYKEAIKQLIVCVNDPGYVSPNNTTTHQLWMQLCDLCANHVDVATTTSATAVVDGGDNAGDVIPVEAIIRKGIEKFSDEVGRLWGRLADFYVRQGLFEKARSVFEEALLAVVTVKDFTIIFDKYIKVEEKVLAAKLQWLEELENEINNNNNNNNEENEEDKKELAELQEEVEGRLARIDSLLVKRPLLLNSVVLRQNPHNVFEWLKRVKIIRDSANSSTTTTTTTTTTTRKSNGEEEENVGFGTVVLDESQRQQIVNTFKEAIVAVDPKNAVGKLSHIYMAYVKFMEQQQQDIPNARRVYEQAVQIDFRSVEELANVWCAWAEMEIRLEQFERALQVLTKAVADPPKRKKQTTTTTTTIVRNNVNKAVITSDDDNNNNNNNNKDSEMIVVPEKTPATALVYKNVKIWNLLLDLEESIGTVETCRACYDRVIELKVVTPQMMLNYALYLEEKHFYDDSFRVYEKAISLFVYPTLRLIWLTYIDKFIARYAGTKIERLRDMFENAIASVPAEHTAEYYIKYAKTEEEFGLTRQAMAVYDRACRAVVAKEQLNMYRLYIRKTEQYYGVTKTRPVYERALTELGDDDCRELCLEFADMETKLGEVDRARAVLQYGSQFAPPNRYDESYWKHWRQFEEAHGNEDSFREMLRIKRSVATAFSQTPGFVLATTTAGGAGVGDSKKRGVESDGNISFLPEQKRATLA